MKKTTLFNKSLLRRASIFQMECKVKLKACQKLQEQKIEVSNLNKCRCVFTYKEGKECPDWSLQSGGLIPQYT